MRTVADMRARVSAWKVTKRYDPTEICSKYIQYEVSMAPPAIDHLLCRNILDKQNKITLDLTPTAKGLTVLQIGRYSISILDRITKGKDRFNGF